MSKANDSVDRVVSHIRSLVGDAELLRVLKEIEGFAEGSTPKKLKRIWRDMKICDVSCLDGG